MNFICTKMCADMNNIEFSVLSLFGGKEPWMFRRFVSVIPEKKGKQTQRPACCSVCCQELVSVIWFKHIYDLLFESLQLWLGYFLPSITGKLTSRQRPSLTISKAVSSAWCYLLPDHKGLYFPRVAHRVGGRLSRACCGWSVSDTPGGNEISSGLLYRLHLSPEGSSFFKHGVILVQTSRCQEVKKSFQQSLFTSPF